MTVRRSVGGIDVIPARRHHLLAALVVATYPVHANADEAPQEQAPPLAAPAETDDRELADLRHRLDVVEARALAFEQRLADEQAAATKRSPVVTVAPGKGLTIKTSDGNYALTVRARTQIRETVTHDDINGYTNETAIKAARLFTTGHVLSPDVRYSIQLAFGAGELEKGNPSPILDSFVEYTRLRDLNIRVGQFFVPFDRARTIREFALQMVDRPQVVRELTLDRDVGVMLSSSDLFGTRGVLSYNFFADSDTDPIFIDLVRTRGRQVGGGLNVYLNGHAFKLQGDYVYAFGRDATAPYHVAHLQLDASF